MSQTSNAEVPLVTNYPLFRKKKTKKKTAMLENWWRDQSCSHRNLTHTWLEIWPSTTLIKCSVVPRSEFLGNTVGPFDSFKEPFCISLGPYGMKYKGLSFVSHLDPMYQTERAINNFRLANGPPSRHNTIYTYWNCLSRITEQWWWILF